MLVDGETGDTSCLSVVEQDWEALTDSCCPPGEREEGESVAAVLLEICEMGTWFGLGLCTISFSRGESCLLV